MTAHRAKPTITPERVDWFARYYAENRAWGVFHVSLDDGNYTLGASEGRWDNEGGRWVHCGRAEWADDLREAAGWFDALTPTQRRKLGRKAEARAVELGLVRA